MSHDHHSTRTDDSHAHGSGPAHAHTQGHHHNDDHEHEHEHDHDHGHGHGHGHGHHHHAHDGNGLGIAFWLIGGFMIIEAIGGIWSGSLTLLADAGHMFVDTLALALAYFANQLSQRPASRSRSFGHSRLQVLAAFVNSLLLLGIVAAILYEATQRLLAPHAMTHPPVALAVATAGIGVNLIAAWLLHGNHHNLNVRAAYLHVLSDLLGAGAAALAALIAMTTDWIRADAWLSLVVTALIARGAWQLLRHSAHVLQEGTPEGFDAEALARHLTHTVPGVTDIHHVHAWSLTPSETLLTLHGRLDANADHGATLTAIKQILTDRYGIQHSTIQLEPSECVDGHDHCTPAQSVSKAAHAAS